MTKSARLSRRQALVLTSAAALVPGAVAAQGGDIRIGTVLSVTGPAAFLGEDMKRGMEIAIDEINAAGGIKGRKIKWHFYDAESHTAKAITATKRMLSQDKVEIVVGGGNMSGIALAMVPVIQDAKRPFIATEGAMSIVNPVASRPLAFKSTVDDDDAVSRALDYLKKKNVKKVALLYSTEGFGQSAEQQMKRVAPGYGFEAVTYEGFAPTDTDLTPQLTKLKAAGVQAIICWTVTPTGVVFMKQAKQLQMNDVILIHSYGFVSQRYMQLAGDAAKDVLLISVKFPVGADLPAADPTKAQIQSLTEKYTKRYGRPPNQFVAQTYDAIYLAKLAIEKAGSTDSEKVRAALQTIKGYRGASGEFNFSPERHSGLTKKDLVLVKWEGGKFRLADY
ncbi:MAG: ABC transporter substrate-binding protein [Rhodospirillaceae bacterium]|nr:ABC transporter substrate-binding protein [Rhodospirillaceae bacterium]